MTKICMRSSEPMNSADSDTVYDRIKNLYDQIGAVLLADAILDAVAATDY